MPLLLRPGMLVRPYIEDCSVAASVFGAFSAGFEFAGDLCRRTSGMLKSREDGCSPCSHPRTLPRRKVAACSMLQHMSVFCEVCEVLGALQTLPATLRTSVLFRLRRSPRLWRSSLRRPSELGAKWKQLPIPRTLEHEAGGGFARPEPYKQGTDHRLWNALPMCTRSLSPCSAKVRSTSLHRARGARVCNV